MMQELLLRVRIKGCRTVCGLLFIYESDFKWKPQLFPCFSFMLQQGYDATDLTWFVVSPLRFTPFSFPFRNSHSQFNVLANHSMYLVGYALCAKYYSSLSTNCGGLVLFWKYSISKWVPGAQLNLTVMA